MSVRKRKWRDKQGRQHTRWMIHVEHTWPNGRKQTIRKVSPVQTKRGAEQYEREVRKSLVSGSWKEQKTPTLGDFAEDFLKYQSTLNKPSELANKKMILRVHLLLVFGSKRLDRIDERSIDAYKVAKLAERSRKGKPYSAATLNKHLKLLRRMLNVARKWKLIVEVPELSLVKERKPDFDFLDFDEAEAFIAAAKAHLPQWHPFVVVALRTGLRIGELVALRWREDIDLERGRLRVQQSYNPHNGFTTTKNDKVRELPFTWDAIEALRVQRERVDTDRVFPGADGQVLTANTSNAALQQIADAIGLRHVHNHMQRHSFASAAVMRGIPIRQVQEWLGHGSIVVTMRYAHLARGLGDEMIRRLAPQPPAELQHTDHPRNSDPSEFPPLHPSNNPILH